MYPDRAVGASAALTGFLHPQLLGIAPPVDAAGNVLNPHADPALAAAWAGTRAVILIEELESGGVDPPLRQTSVW